MVGSRWLFGEHEYAVLLWKVDPIEAYYSCDIVEYNKAEVVEW